MRRIISSALLALTTLLSGCGDHGPADIAQRLPPLPTVDVNVPCSYISWWTGSSLEIQIDDAALTGRPILLYFYAEWCGYCDLMLKTTWKDPRVLEAFAEGMYIAVKVDIDRFPKILKDFHVATIPTVKVLNVNEKSQITVRAHIGGYDADPLRYRDLLLVGSNDL